MKTLILIVALFALAAPLSACNTVDGFGRDLENAGGAIRGH